MRKRAHTALGWVSWCAWTWAAAERELKYAVALSERRLALVHLFKLPAWSGKEPRLWLRYTSRSVPAEASFHRSDAINQLRDIRTFVEASRNGVVSGSMNGLNIYPGHRL